MLAFCFSTLQATEAQSGMDMFSIPQPPYKELAFLEHELDLLSKMWGVVAEWETTYGGWKNGHFKELKVRHTSRKLPPPTACLSLHLLHCRHARQIYSGARNQCTPYT